MKNCNLEKFGMTSLSLIETVNVNGGHDGTAYHIGKAAGEVVKFVSTCAFIVIAIFTPKS
ncbi:MAG: hypothetical protein Q8K64_01205 [Sediminibacterium sp.]|nr:hypothetical protein [Sediminibacterium sp.]